MRKVSYILSILGLILIIIAVIIIRNNNEIHNHRVDNSYVSNILWNVEYEKGVFNAKDFTEYDSKTYKNVIINQNRAYATNYYSYIVPDNVYLNSTLNNLVNYADNSLRIIRTGNILEMDNIDYYDERFEDYLSNDYLNISSYKMLNGNGAYLIKTIKDNNYEEILRLYIKADKGYYKVEYHLINQKFSNHFIDNVLKENNELQKNDQDTSGIWNLSLDLPKKKHFTLRFDNNKYQIASELNYEDYMISFFDDNNNILIASLLYDETNDVEQHIVSKYGEYYKFVLDETIKNYPVKTYVDNNNENGKMYIISLDTKTKILIVSGSRNMDINEFLDISYQ